MIMAVCVKCGKEMKKDTRFCKACGSGQETVALHDAKRARVLAAEKRGPNKVVLIAVAAAVIVAGWFGYGSSGRMSGGEQLQPSRQGNRGVQYLPVHAESGRVTVDAAALDGRAVYYIYDNGGRPVKFFLLRATDGTVRAAFDACTACNHAKLGYRQEGDVMVCNNCGMAFRSTSVGKTSGGCSPIPLENRQEGATVVIAARDLEAGAKYF
jgi:hypothetical protein